ncbi:Uma2 family endonuclease [Stratiformator vulcanicus]|uniref:Putative restriction endonuclease domain-containing protein n=1 Tax=Stratiformator vulcanicus TaxID=2527980 RepID=A0A517R7G2_9PLAN|nr:Uma2 family endonuclease [Stratiformator vulcanicus]QDT39773.1 hypothetical protein Pan189_41840 [Stratiformator vulcanicus]
MSIDVQALLPREESATEVPPLVNGDHLTLPEFLRRYEAMPELKKAELIDGRVYMGSPVRTDRHGEPHSDLIGWLSFYKASTPGVGTADNSTVLLDIDNSPQPDASLRIKPEYGGQTRMTEKGYIQNAPELVCEVAASSASYDLHEKLHAYRRSGVREYLVWMTQSQSIAWFVLREGNFEQLDLDDSGRIESETFPGLVLDVQALVEGDLKQVLDVLAEGMKSEAHHAFVDRLKSQRSTHS